MEKRANRILSALIALVMVLSMLPAAVFATGETASVLEGWSITLGDSIGVNFYLNSADYTVTTTVSGAAVTPMISDKVVTVNVAAAQMNDPIVLTVKSGEETVHTDEYSVREYAETILSGEYDDYVKQIVKEMLNYGAAAQTYFAYNADNLANAGYEMDATAQVPTEVPEVTVEDNLAGIGLYGMSLVFRSKTAVRFYFTVSGNIADYTFKVGETAYEPVEKDGLYYVEIGDINPQDLDKTVTVNVNDSLSVSYSPLNYIVRKYNNENSSAELKALVQAMYCYHLEAKYYNSVVPVGALQSSGHGWSEGGIYATMSENDAYYVESDWSIEYTPVNADVIKLVRGGVTTSVGVPGNGALIKFTATDYYLKTSSDTIGGDVLPLQDQDYLIVDGRFYHPATGSVMYISKTYIYNNGGTLEFSTTEPVLPVSYDVGVLQAHTAGAGGSGIYFSTAEVNDAPYGDWNTYYDTASVDCLKLVRGGETISVGLTGRNTICKFGANDYYLRLENHTIGDYAPFTTDDMFIVEGAFTHVNSKTTLNIAKTYIYHDGSAWVFSAAEPVIEPETESPFTFNKGVFSADIFSNRNNGLSVSVENQQLKLQQPEGASNWLWLKQEMKAGTVVTMDVTFSGEGMSIYGYGAKENGDPITEGTVTDSVPQGWFWGQGGSASGSYTFTIYEDCYGLSLMLGFASSTETAIYIDNVVIVEPAETESPFTFDGGSYSADIFSNRNNGLSVSVENKQLKLQQPEGASNWLWIKQNMPAGTTVTMDVTLSAEGMNIFGYGAKENGDPITEGTVSDSVPQGWFWGQGGSASGSYTFTIYEDCYGLSLMLGFASSTETAIYIDNVAITAPETTVNVYEVGVLAPHSAGVNVDSETGYIKGIYAVGATTEATYDTGWNVDYAPISAENIQLIRDGVTYNVGVPGTRTLILFSQTDYYLDVNDGTFTSSLLPIQDGDILVLEGQFSCNQDANSIINITKTYISISGNSAAFSAVDPRIINVETMYAYEAGYSTSSDGNISGIYFMNEPNAVPGNADWSVRYAATDVSNVKLIRNGATTDIAVVGANTIVKMSDQAGWLCLENSSIISTYPVVAGDILVVEGAFRNSSNGYTMVIDKTYIVIGSDGVSFTTQYEETDYGTVILPTSVDALTIGTWAGSYHDFTDERLAELKKAGITKILGVNPAEVGGENNNDVAVLLDRCAKYGISVVIDLRDWDGSTVPSYANHSNLIGFLMYDEPNTADFETLAALKTQFDAVMPADKLFYVNLFPECASDSSLGELTWWDELVGTDLDYDEDYVTAFLNAMDIEVLSWDNYSLLEGSGIRTDYYHNFEVMAGKNLPLWYTMLSAGHSAGSITYATPTATELRWQMAVAMTYGVQNIDHYVYYSHETDYSCMLQCVDGVYSTTALYDDILAVDNEYLAWDNIFMAYDWKGVAGVQAGSSSTMLGKLENNIDLTANGLASVSTTQDVLVGVFDYNGDKAYMVTNAGSAGSTTVGDGVNFTMTDATVTLTLADGDYKCVAIIDQGVITYVAVENNTVTIPVSAYEGVFVIPVLN